MLFCQGPFVRPADLELGKQSPPSGEAFQQAKARVVVRFEREYHTIASAVNRGNASQAARSAGKYRRDFLELIRKHQIDLARSRS